MRLKSRNAELKQRAKISLGKYVSMFRHDCSYNIWFIFANTKPRTYRIPKNQNIPNALSKCLETIIRFKS